MEDCHDYTFVDTGLWIDGVGVEVGEAIKNGVAAFRDFHQVSASAWHVRAYGLSDGLHVDVWIGRGSSPSFRLPFTLLHSVDTGEKVRSLLEGMLNPP